MLCGACLLASCDAYASPALAAWPVFTRPAASPSPQMFIRFLADDQLQAAALAAAGGSQPGGAPSSSGGGAGTGGPLRAAPVPSSSSGGNGSSRPGLRRRVRQAWRSWEEQQLPAAHAAGTASAAPADHTTAPPPPCDADSAQGWPRWGLPLLLAGTLWHTIDTLLW